MSARFRIHQKFRTDFAKPEEKINRQKKEEVIVLEDGQVMPEEETDEPKEVKEEPRKNVFLKLVKGPGMIMRKRDPQSFM